MIEEKKEKREGDYKKRMNTEICIQSLFHLALTAYSFCLRFPLSEKQDKKKIEREKNNNVSIEEEKNTQHTLDVCIRISFSSLYIYIVWFSPESFCCLTFVKGYFFFLEIFSSIFSS